MQVEYRIEFQAGGLTITQRVEPNSTGPLVRPDAAASVSAQNSALVKPDAVVKHGAELTAKFGVEEHASAANALGALTEGKPRDGAGVHDSTDPGGGGPQSGVVIVFGPIIVLPTGAAGSGGGVHDSTDPGGHGLPKAKAT
jgi:hypothetical protein